MAWNIKDWKPPPSDSIWQCPCGYTATWKSAMAHRKGWKNRPECNGRLSMVHDPTATPEDLATAAADAAADGPVFDDTPVSPTFTPSMSVLDPEEVARQLNRGRRPIDLEGAVLDLQHTLDDMGDEAADWSIETPEGVSVASQAKETVSLPVVVRVMYDWAKNQGWHQGDGTLSSFVTDVVLDHFENCWGKRIVVVDETQLSDGMDEDGDEIGEPVEELAGVE